jgi:Helicase associated domain
LQQNHHCNVNKQEDPNLYKWVARQRGERNEFLSADRRALLDAIHFEWDGSRETACEIQWEINFNKLKQYAKGDGPWTASMMEKWDKTVGTWAANQRRRFNKGMMREDRIAKLESIGFPFGEARKARPQKIGKMQEEKWERMYQRLVDFKRFHGHTEVPYGYKDDKSLGLWVSTNRREYNQKSWYGANRSIREDRKKKLEDIGFVWNAYLEREASVSNDSEDQPGYPGKKPCS